MSKTGKVIPYTTLEVRDGHTFVVCLKSKGYEPNESDFTNFSKQLYETGDLDPVYPVLKLYFETNRYTLEEKLFGVHLYLTLYNTYWTLYFLEKYRGKFTWDNIILDEAVINKKVKFGNDRRGVRAQGLVKVLPMFIKFYGDNTLESYYTDWMTKDGVANYLKLKELVLDVPQNGSWAGYKHIDLLNNSCDLNITCTDWWIKGRAFGGKQLVVDWHFGVGKKLGRDIPESSEIVELIESFADTHTYNFKKSISKDVTYDVSETMACKFHALYGGTYYVGHDIDKMQEELYGYDTSIDKLLTSLRSACFDIKYLGEYSGWDGVRKAEKGRLITDYTYKK